MKRHQISILPVKYSFDHTHITPQFNEDKWEVSPLLLEWSIAIKFHFYNTKRIVLEIFVFIKQIILH